MNLLRKNPFIQRLLQLPLLVLGVCSITFVLLHSSPGDPLDRYISPATPPETIALIRNNYGFDQPLHHQYLKWLEQLVHGNFGYSLSHHRPVRDLLLEAVRPTLELTVPAFILTFAIGLFAGAIAALHRERRLDRYISGTLLAIYCMPGFWLALMLILLFSIQLGWLPATYGSLRPGIEAGGWSALWQRLPELVLPVLTLGLAGAASTGRHIRERLLQVLDAPFVVLARAKGLSTWQLFRLHLWRHTLLPLVSLAGLSLPMLLGGAFLIEIIFAWPGLGRITYEAIFAHDFPVVLATTMLTATLVLTGNLLADLLYALADPRIRKG